MMMKYVIPSPTLFLIPFLSYICNSKSWGGMTTRLVYYISHLSKFQLIFHIQTQIDTDKQFTLGNEFPSVPG